MQGKLAKSGGEGGWITKDAGLNVHYNNYGTEIKRNIQNYEMDAPCPFSLICVNFEGISLYHDCTYIAIAILHS